MTDHHLHLHDETHEALIEAIQDGAEVAFVNALIARHVRAELLDVARYFEYEMAPAWGGGTTWISTGSHVADLVANVLRERAAEVTPS